MPLSLLEIEKDSLTPLPSVNYERLVSNLEYLNLKQILIHLEDESSNSNISLIDGLLKLTDYEVENKRKVASSQMIKVANFPHVKTINDFDFNFNPEVNENQIKMLCTLKFLENNENIIFFGNSGVGKTHLATSIGIESAKKE
nr:ATP-binding protein [Helcococcus ovis]